ncbi:MAG: zf-HC2 domain-containing protein [Pyrinomonadaceae bacterium]|nr:zf-HC2 domain-containing protein [Pyrinomonadaceae bacterium]
MKCKDLKSELPLYVDDVLPAETAAAIDGHLTQCPLCRQELADIRDIRSSLRALQRPQVPAARLAAIRSTVASLAQPVYPSPSFRMVGEERRNWVDVWLMPYAVGACSSVILGITMLWLIFLPASREAALLESQTAAQAGEVMLASNDEITPIQYASTRLAVANESPSVNPQGALVALTRSLMRGEMKDEEVVIVADVFGDGLARIAEVVEPSRDERAVRELKKALQSDPAFAPFVPANIDHRAENVRVVLRVHTIAVTPDDHGGVY